MHRQVGSSADPIERSLHCRRTNPGARGEAGAVHYRDGGG